MHAQGSQTCVLLIIVNLQTRRFSPAQLLELALEVFSLTYPDMWSLTPYKCTHQTEKKQWYENNLLQQSEKKFQVNELYLNLLL